MKSKSLFGMVLCGMLVSVLPLAADVTAYSHDSTPQQYFPSWMSQVADKVTLSQLSLPGTHETLSMGGGDAVQCQSMDLYNQLMAGIRVIDIRLGPGYGTNQLIDYHGSIDQGTTFDQVLSTLTTFLSQYPTETVLMRVDNEAPNGTYYDTGLTQLDAADFTAVFKTYWQANANLFYNPNLSTNSGYQLNPPLSAMRGKVVVLDDFSANRAGNWTTQFGLNYGGLNAQDNYTVNSNWDLYTKWEEVEQQLTNSTILDAIGNPNHTVFINYLSASGGSFPYFIASGKSSPGTNAPQLMTGETTPGWNNYPDFPRVNCFLGVCSIEFLGTNYLTSNYLGQLKTLKGVGIIMADFPGALLIWQVAEQNGPQILF